MCLRFRTRWSSILALAVAGWIAMAPFAVADDPEAIAELRALDQRGALTVRALRAWDQLPAPLMQVVLELHRHGIDLLEADRVAVEALIEQAGEADGGPANERLDALQALAAQMRKFAAPPIDASADPEDSPPAAVASPRTQRAIARELLREIDELEDWEHEPIERLYLRLIAEAPDTPEAEEAHWRLTNLYMRGFDPARDAEAAALLEQYRQRYPGSAMLDQRFAMFSTPGLSLVDARLLYLYDETEAWDKAAAFYKELIPDPSAAPPSLIERFIAYGRTLEASGREADAVAIYQAYLKQADPPSEILKRAAHSRLQALGAMPVDPVTYENIFAAAAAGVVDEVRRHVDEGADLQAHDQTGSRSAYTALQFAVAGGHRDVVEYLLGHGADPNQVGGRREGQSPPLWLAIGRGDVAIVARLVDAGARTDVRDGRGDTPLVAALRGEQEDIVDALLARGVDPNPADERATVPLHMALHTRNGPLFARLLEYGADPDRPFHREPLLHWVARDGQLGPDDRATMLSALLGAGVDINETNARGRTALLEAAAQGNAQATVLLLEAGARLPPADERGNTLAHHAARDGHAELITVFAEAGIGVDVINERGETALHLAAERGHMETVATLLAAGADPTVLDRNGRSAPLRAHRRGHTEVVALFGERGLLVFPNLLEAAADGDPGEVGRHLAREADLAATDDEGNTALHLAVAAGHAEAARLLIEAGADIDARNGLQATPLHLAAANGDMELLAMLRAQGADQAVLRAEHALDTRGNTALHRAAGDGHAEAVRLLVESGVAIDPVNRDGETPLLAAFWHAFDVCERISWQDETRLGPLVATHPARQTLSYLLDQGARADVWDTDAGFTLLHLAALMGDQGLAERLLDGGAQLDATADGELQPVHMAMLMGHAELSAWMIEQGARPNLSKHGGPLLHLAMDREHERLPGIALLLEYGADVDARNEYGATVLLDGGWRDAALFELLLAHGVDVDAADADGTTLLSMLTENRHDPEFLAIAERLVELGAAVTDSGWPELRVAAIRGDRARVAALLSEGLDGENGDWAWSVLHAAARAGHADVVRTLLDGGVDLREVERVSRTPLLLAAQQGHRPVVELLLERGADVEELGQALHRAIAYDRDRELVARMHAAGVDLNSPYGYAPPALFMAEDEEMLVFLIDELGVDMNQTVEAHRTRLFEAVDAGDEVMVAALLARGASTDARGGVWDRTPLHIAVERDHPEILALLLEHGADVDARDNDERTALHLAAYTGNLAAAQQLVAAGADLNARDDIDRTPRDLAAHARHAEVLRFLRGVNQ